MRRSEKKNYCFFQELSGIYYDLFIKDYPCKDEDMYKWLEDFCNQLPTDTMKTFIRELLYIKQVYCNGVLWYGRKKIKDVEVAL